MTQCSLCQYLGPWVLTELEAEKQKRRNDPSYYAYRQDLIYHHHPTWERLRKSASGGCTFCCHIVDAFHDYGITDGRIAELQEQGKGTDVSIRKGVYDDMLRLQCGILRPHGLLIGTYVLPGSGTHLQCDSVNLIIKQMILQLILQPHYLACSTWDPARHQMLRLQSSANGSTDV